MFKLSYKIEYNTDPQYPNSKNFGNCGGILCPTEEYANGMLDLVAKQGTILETNLVELVNYVPSKRVVFATTRSWE